MHLREKDTTNKRTELERYLNESFVDGDDQLDILIWWTIKFLWFSIISRMVRDLLATPISTYVFKSAFSIGSKVLDAFISSLNPPMTEADICVQNWLKTTIH